jgi:hypothetical protein
MIDFQVIRAKARDLADLALVRTAAPDFGLADRKAAGKYVVPATKISLLTVTSKMPSASWSLPAHYACPFAVTDTPDHICSHCYASKGAYVWGLTVRAQWTRFYWTLGCMRDERLAARWVDTLTAAVTADAVRQQTSHARKHGVITANTYFRWHDSGDLFSPAYAAAVLAVVKATPTVRHWIPTRSYRAPWQAAIQAIAAQPNATVRPSALTIGYDAPMLAGYSAGSGVKREGYNCPAPSQGNACADCRACWDAPTVPIYYHAH